MGSKLMLRRVTIAASVAAAYCALTYVLSPIAFGPLQLRVAEAMAVLPFLFPEAAAGLFVGCIVSNLLSSYGVLDVVIGSLATLCAALLTARTKSKYVAPFWPVVFNAFAVGFTITFYEAGYDFRLFSLTLYAVNVGLLALSQTLVCYGIGLPLLIASERIMKKTVGKTDK